MPAVRACGQLGAALLVLAAIVLTTFDRGAPHITDGRATDQPSSSALHTGQSLASHHEAITSDPLTPLVTAQSALGTLTHALRRTWSVARDIDTQAAVQHSTRRDLRAIADARIAFSSILLIVATGSMSFRATSLPPPAIS